VKGNNDLRWNQATIIEAVQEYLNRRYTPNVKVTSVSPVAGYGNDADFKVMVEEIPQVPASASAGATGSSG